MLVFHGDRIVLITDQKQIAVRVRRADGVALFHAVERQHHRRQHIRAVAEAGIRRFHAEDHMRKAKQRLLNRLLQFIRLDLIAHTDDMPRHTGNSFMRIIQKNLCVTIRAEQRIILEHIHSYPLRGRM